MEITPQTRNVYVAFRFLFTAFALGILSSSVFAQAKQAPSGWKAYNWGTDEFNSGSLGWQWNAAVWLESGKLEDSGAAAKTLFRADNAVFQDGQLVIKNVVHGQDLSHNGQKYRHSGAWVQSKANWFTEGQFQVRSKVDWNTKYIWPAAWTICNPNNASDSRCADTKGDELDFFEYQSNYLNMSHHLWTKGQSASTNQKRTWFPWQVPDWEYQWSLAQVRNWGHWAVVTTRDTTPKFYLNNKQEFTPNFRKAISAMQLLLTSSPHKNHLPASGNLPSFRIDWIRTHIP